MRQKAGENKMFIEQKKDYFGKGNISIFYFQEVNINNSELKHILNYAMSLASVVLMNANVEHCISSCLKSTKIHLYSKYVSE